MKLDWDPAQLQAVLEDADVRALATRRHQMALRRSFESHDAQALGWQSHIAEAVKRENAGRFHCHPLCRPGVALEIRSPGGSTRYAVIGHSDEHGDLSTPAIADNEACLSGCHPSQDFDRYDHVIVGVVGVF